MLYPPGEAIIRKKKNKEKIENASKIGRNWWLSPTELVGVEDGTATMENSKADFLKTVNRMTT